MRGVPPRQAVHVQGLHPLRALPGRHLLVVLCHGEQLRIMRCWDVLNGTGRLGRHNMQAVRRRPLLDKDCRSRCLDVCSLCRRVLLHCWVLYLCCVPRGNISGEPRVQHMHPLSYRDDVVAARCAKRLSEMSLRIVSGCVRAFLAFYLYSL